MSIEALLWGMVPALIAVITGMASAVISLKALGIWHKVFSIIVVVLDALSLWLLFGIFILGGWPTFLPHIFIGITVLVVAIQTILFWRQRREASYQGGAGNWPPPQ